MQVPVRRLSGAREIIELPDDVQFFTIWSEFDNDNDDDFFIRDLMISASGITAACDIAKTYHNEGEKITRVVPMKPIEAAIWKARGVLHDQPKETIAS